ncbi:hypothetical protein BGZ61DRAFT_459806 [Ilyonectria robusta]|uniref:uncharacterized protein n=1 Tax=Ilyonectria robusta TaxID=1079257 RepID=UPI001E8CF07D|nr:uncharacterized protein BGZ61DRAFT_459806 [Ilyonectria robusta]KAH8670731.1 hypothetical protein BGZ61DRAFT_459806 [Ilyonectria robusta]
MPPPQETDPRAPSWALAEEKQRKKPGPKPKPLGLRPYKPTKPIVRRERSYSPKKKEEVIMWLIHHRVTVRGEYRRPNPREAGDHFKIPSTTINNWMKAYFKNHPKLEKISTTCWGPVPVGNGQPTPDPREKPNSANGAGIEERPQGTERASRETGTGTEKA